MNKIIITGAAGFIGCNLSIFLQRNFDLILIDNFSRQGSQKNESILLERGLKVENIDVSNSIELFVFLNRIGTFDSIIHLAAQTSLLESFVNPKLDFDTNALGTLNILEYLRNHNPKAKGIFLSSNKVYGSLNQLKYFENNSRYIPENGVLAFDESLPILPVGGYSISKSISDAYVIEYGKRYSMPVISLRQSAVYGPNQNARSDQGWVTFFIEQIKNKEKVYLRGSGKQVRDILHVNDFSKLIFKLLTKELENGEFYNVGGGVNFSLSILELFDLIAQLTGEKMDFEIGLMSSEDQKYFVSDNTKISKFAEWSPSIAPDIGVKKLVQN